MAKSSRRIKLMLGLLPFAVGSYAAAANPASASMPSDISLIESNSSYNVLKNGSFDETTSMTFQAMTDDGRVKLSIQQINYLPQKSSLEIKSASIIQDGVESVVPAAKFVTKDISNPANGLTNARQVTIPFEGVRIGTKIRYSYVRKFFKPSMEGFFDLALIYGAGFPESNSNVVINSEIPLELTVQDSEKRLSISQSQDGSTQRSEIRTVGTIHVYSDLKQRPGPPDTETARKIPSVRISAKYTWDEFAARFNSTLKPNRDSKFPPHVEAFIKSLKKKQPSEQISEIRKWISLNLTYSGRWTSANSDWIPRPIEQILKSKVGDCKDFALVLEAMLQKLEIPANIAVVNTGTDPSVAEALLHPVAGKTIPPSPGYFDHAIVRIYSGENSIYVDPTVNLSQGSHTDFHLHNKASWTITRGESLKLIKIRPGPEATFESNLFPGLGGFRVQTKIVMQGPLAEYVQSVRFGSQPNLLGETLSTMVGYPAAENVRIIKQSGTDRSSSSLSFELEFYVSKQFIFNTDSTITYSHRSNLSALVLNGRPNGSFYPSLDFPFSITSRTTLPKYYVAQEVDLDRLEFGPIVKYSRRVSNTDGGVNITERSRFDMTPPSIDSDSKDIFGYHVDGIKSCMGDQIRLQTQNVNDPRQIRFESSVDPDANKVSDVQVWKFQKGLIAHWRRFEFLLSKSPKNPKLLSNLARVFYRIGMINGQLYVPEFLNESKMYSAASIALDPTNAEAWAHQGYAEIYGNETAKAVISFQQGNRLDPKNFFVNRLGGIIAQRNARPENAIRFYKAAELGAASASYRRQAVEDQISVLCSNITTCPSAEPLLDRLINEDLDPWQMNNLSNNYVELRKYDKAASLLRGALKKMKFGMAEKNLRNVLALQAYEVMEDRSASSTKLQAAEKILQEAQSLDPNQTDPAVQRASAWLMLQKTKATQDRSILEQTHIYLEKLRKLPDVNPVAIMELDKEIARVDSLMRRDSRRIASTENQSYSQFFKQAVVDAERRGIGASPEFLMQTFSPSFDDALRACILKIDSNDEAVIVLDKTGKIIEWQNKIDTVETACVKQRMLGQVSGMLQPRIDRCHVAIKIKEAGRGTWQ